MKPTTCQYRGEGGRGPAPGSQLQATRYRLQAVVLSLHRHAGKRQHRNPANRLPVHSAGMNLLESSSVSMSARSPNRWVRTRCRSRTPDPADRRTPRPSPERPSRNRARIRFDGRVKKTRTVAMPAVCRVPTPAQAPQTRRSETPWFPPAPASWPDRPKPAAGKEPPNFASELSSSASAFRGSSTVPATAPRGSAAPVPQAAAPDRDSPATAACSATVRTPRRMSRQRARCRATDCMATPVRLPSR